MGPCIVNVFLSMTNKMQRCITLYIIVKALHDPSAFSVHHQELESVLAASGICQTCLQLTLAVPIDRHGRQSLTRVCYTR
jgi:hypothetical protein